MNEARSCLNRAPPRERYSYFRVKVCTYGHGHKGPVCSGVPYSGCFDLWVVTPAGHNRSMCSAHGHSIAYTPADESHPARKNSPPFA